LTERTEILTPDRIPMMGMNTKVAFIAVGGSHVIAIMRGNNMVFSWGKNKFGECG